ncbi:glutamate-cysteine ligase family protein [Halobellus rubicundus]|uniref:Glutamate-cysteine ligase family protein n=1 Tax=Halobellus rubicundus TaxID=2996466 RepID=A0ABD5MEZ0_9EURY
MSATESAPIRRSIEVEYWVVDETGRLTEPGDLASATGAEREFVEPLLEIKTTPCESAAALRAELLERIREVLRLAEERGKRLVPLATPAAREEITELDSERTSVQNEVVGEDFEHVRHCAGTHIHVEQQPGCAVDQANAFVALDPALALVNSSPYVGGRRVTAGARSELYRRRAYATMSHQGRLWRYLDDTDQWDRRLERRYEEFVAEALAAGIDRQTVEANFSPESAVWTPVQLRARFGTVEWRSPDTALPSQVLRLADRLAAISATVRDAEVRIEGQRGEVSDEAVVLPEFATVLSHVDDAIEKGLASESLRRYLDRMGFDVNAYDPLTQEVDRGRELSDAAARELRLESAERLERDAFRRSAINAD